MVLPLIIALALLAGSLAFFKDDIANLFSNKSEAEKERERQDAKVRNDKGAFKNTSDFLFGEGIAKTPEELQLQKKINERGAFANIQAFLFGEESLKPSNQPPILGSGESSEEATVKRLKLNQFENTASGRNNVFLSVKSRRQKNSKELLVIQNQQKKETEGQRTGESKSIPVVGTPSNENKNNIVPKDVRKGRNTFTQTTVVKEPQTSSKEEVQKVTQPSENKSNIVSKSRRLKSQTRNPSVTPNSQIPVEQKEDSVQIG